MQQPKITTIAFSALLVTTFCNAEVWQVDKYGNPIKQLSEHGNSVETPSIATPGIIEDGKISNGSTTATITTNTPQTPNGATGIINKGTEVIGKTAETVGGAIGEATSAIGGSEISKKTSEMIGNVTGGALEDLANQGKNIIGGKIADKIGGDWLGGIFGGGNGGFDWSSVLNTITNQFLKSNRFDFGNDWLKAQCRISTGQSGNTNICGTIDGIGGGVSRKIGGMFDFKYCSLNSQKERDCFNKHLDNICSKVANKNSNKNSQDMKTYNNNILNNPSAMVLTSADKYLPTTGGDVFAKKDDKCSFENGSGDGGNSDSSSKSDGNGKIDGGNNGGTSDNGSSGGNNGKIDGGNNGGDNSNGNNAYEPAKEGGVYNLTDTNGENIGKKLDVQAKVQAEYIEKNRGGSETTADYIMKCIALQSTSNYTDKNGNINKDNFESVYEACKPENATRLSAGQIENERTKLAETFGLQTILSADESQVEISMLKEALVNQCSAKPTLKEAADCEKKLLTDPNSVAGQIKEQIGASGENPSGLIGNIEKANAFLLSSIYLINPEYLKDTSNETLKQIIPSQRGKFMNDALELDQRAGLLNYYMKKVTDAKKELARLAEKKILACSTPFYATAATNEVSELIKKSQEQAKKVVEEILTK